MKNNHFSVDRVYTSEMIKKYKPSEVFYQYILQQENITPDEAVFIGDSLKDDMIGPKSVGMTTILIDRENRFGTSGGIQPDYVVKSLEEIVEMRL